MEEIGPDVRGCAGSAVVSSGRRRRTLAVRGDYLKITKEELRKELRLRGLRTSSKRIEMASEMVRATALTHRYWD
ncbi:vacuole membrane protein 1-like [Tropilaelaps mercedesae]|uniref:Vacuole membrane protein 1-like n=1 Tax=Tropilaelaps mercedesae TaxID=418985 RepID=A0A1V9XLW5_9ACAR|nr:vacuole membrane protein 1-like [Tropilaelaps mercedesae]